MNVRILTVAIVAAMLFSGSAHALTILGTGDGALVGNDLTDLGNNGVEASYAPPALAGFDAVFFASNEANFSPVPTANEGAFNVFDNLTGGGQNKWCCGAGAGNPITPQIVGANFATTHGPIVLTAFTLTSSNDTAARDPRVWTIEGSNDTTTGLDGTWTAVYSRTDSTTSDWGATRNQVIRYSPLDGDVFLTNNAFTAFRMRTTATGATSGAFFAISEIELFGQAPVNIPEPATLSLLALAGVGLFRRRRAA